jgi:hypothetical protein
MIPKLKSINPEKKEIITMVLTQPALHRYTSDAGDFGELEDQVGLG